MSPERQTGNRAREIVSSPHVRRVVVKLGSGTVTDPGRDFGCRRSAPSRPELRTPSRRTAFRSSS